jgi:glutathione S-transferase
MIKLYGNPYSRANRVRWALETLDTPYEEEETSLGDDGTGSERFRTINPNGLVPVIDDDGLVLFESVPICLYIAKKYAASTLYVDSVEDEGVLLQWSVWAMTELEKHIETASLHVTWFSEKMRDPKVAASEQAEISRCLTMLEQAITARGFLVVNRFTIADLIVSEVLTSLVHAGLDLGSFPAVKEYLQGNLSQASAQKAFTADIIQPYLT